MLSPATLARTHLLGDFRRPCLRSNHHAHKFHALVFIQVPNSLDLISRSYYAAASTGDSRQRVQAQMDTEATAGYSSVQLPKRDNLLLDKHQIEVAISEKKVQKVESLTSDETAKQLFDEVNRGRNYIPFRECYDRLDRQHNQLSAQKKEVTALETKLHNAEEKAKELQKELEARTSYSRCSIFICFPIFC
jgi:hypothetical protein